MLFITLAAAQLSAPIPTNLSDWATYDDVPVEIMPENTKLAVGFRVTVDPNGKPSNCRVAMSSGLKQLDLYSCRLVMKRARFKAARDVNGRLTYGVYESNLAWWVGSSSGPSPSAPFVGDLDIGVSNLPTGMKSPVTIRVMFAVNAQGTLSSCTGEREEDYPGPELVRLACEQVQKQLQLTPVTNNVGVPVPSVQDAVVRFTTH